MNEIQHVESLSAPAYGKYPSHLLAAIREQLEQYANLRGPTAWLPPAFARPPEVHHFTPLCLHLLICRTAMVIVPTLGLREFTQVKFVTLTRVSHTYNITHATHRYHGVCHAKKVNFTIGAEFA